MPFGKSKHATSSASATSNAVDSSPGTSSRASLASVVGNLDAPSSNSNAHSHAQDGRSHRTSGSSKSSGAPASNSAHDDVDHSTMPVAARDSSLFGNEAASSIAAAASATTTIYAFGHYCHFLHKYEASLHMKFTALSPQDFDTVLHLDKWLSRTMPEHIKRRGFAKLEEIVEMSDWRIQRQIRTNLALGPMVKQNTPEDVERITSNAWHKGGASGSHHQHPSVASGKNSQASAAQQQQSSTSAADAYAWIADAMKELLQLKGVGIPTASVIMMTFWPDQCVPLQEEVFEFFFPKERALFCIATYKRYLDRIRAKAAELNTERERLLTESRDSQGGNASTSRKNSVPPSHRASFQEGNFPCNVDLTVQFDLLKVWKAVFSFQLLKFTEDLSGG